MLVFAYALALRGPPIAKRLPGVAVAGSLGLAAETVAKRMPVSLSPLLYATALGIGVGNAARVVDYELPNVDFVKKRLLRAGIVLYGAKITFAKLLDLGLAGLITDLYSVASTLTIGLVLGGLLGLSRTLATLIATGSAICGCSAVAATQPIVDAPPHEVAAAVGVVVLCGTVAMFLYPFLFRYVANAKVMAIYTGATVHELAGVVAAGASMGPEIASTALVTKLLRVLLLEPWILLLYYFGGFTSSQLKTTTKRTVPWFALGFVGVATFNSIVGIPRSVQPWLATMSAFFLASAMAALGLDTDLTKVRQLGIKPILLALILWLNLVVGGYFVAATTVRLF